MVPGQEARHSNTELRHYVRNPSSPKDQFLAYRYVLVLCPLIPQVPDPTTSAPLSRLYLLAIFESLGRCWNFHLQCHLFCTEAHSGDKMQKAACWETLTVQASTFEDGYARWCCANSLPYPEIQLDGKRGECSHILRHDRVTSANNLFYKDLESKFHNTISLCY